VGVLILYVQIIFINEVHILCWFNFAYCPSLLICYVLLVVQLFISVVDI
jgi:hypothetical protein